MNANERIASIKDAVDRARDGARKGTPIPTHPLWCRERWQDFHKHLVPVDALVLNIDNRRFAAERKLMEEGLGHSLDPENDPNDEQSVISILLDTGHRVDGDVVTGTPSKDYQALLKDWQKRGRSRHSGFGQTVRLGMAIVDWRC